MVVVLPVGPNQLEAGALFYGQPPQHIGSRCPIVGRCRRNHDGQQQPQCINDDMALHASQFRARIVSAFATDLGPFDCLTVDTSGARTWLTAVRHTHVLPKGIRNSLPSAVIAPLGEVVVNGALGRQIVRQHTPLAARTVEVEDGVEHFTHFVAGL
jgi:hypothetical protein